MSEILLVDAFARRPFEGNQAAVVLLDGPADDAWMQSLAGELGYGATCFYHDGELRWFSPTLELTLCGHGTLADHPPRLAQRGPRGAPIRPIDADILHGRASLHGLRFRRPQCPAGRPSS